MATITPVETDPDILAEISAYNQGEQIELSEPATEALGMLTDIKDNDAQPRIVIGRIATRRAHKNSSEILYGIHPTCRPTGKIVEDFDDAEGIFAVHSAE